MPPKAKTTGKSAAANTTSSSKKAEKAKPTKAQDDRTLYYVCGAAAAFVALLVGSAHLLKRARRAERRRLAAMTEEERADEEARAAAARWVVSEDTMAAVAAGLLLLFVFGVIAYYFGARIRAKYATMRETMHERAERAAAATAKATAAVQNREQRLAARAAARERLAAERAGQRAFEAELLAEIARLRASDQQAAAEAAAARLEEHQAAIREAERIEAEQRARASASAAAKGLAGGFDEDDDDWDVGEWEEAEWDDGAGAGAATAADDADADAGHYEDEEAEGSAADLPASQRVALSEGPARGTRIRLEGLVLPEAATLRVDALWVQLACTRCSEPTELILSGLLPSEAERKAWCEKCASMLSAALRPALMHGESALLGHVDTLNCTVADVPRTSVLATCGRCYGEMPVPELLRGRRVNTGCRQCHAPMQVQMANVGVERLAGGGGGGRGGGKKDDDDDDDELEGLLKKLRKKNADQLKSLGISVGKPLPNKGACSHFKHSYRWLRFPCCGRAHPCAMCHAASDCPAADLGAWANRMLCGKCSKEMPYSDKPCDSCGNTFHGPGGAHWQGGEGCRDQRRLDSKDSRKHKGASVDGVKKSTSTKNHRVGALGKANTAAKKASNARVG